MAIQRTSIVNLPVSTLLALIVTTLLFIAIPLLTKISTMHKKQVKAYHVMISQRKPPPPPEPEQERELKEMKKEAAPKEAQQRRKMPTPKLNIPTSGLSANMSGTIQISGLLKHDLKVSDSLFVSAFNLNEVDQPPRLIRAIKPIYPFEAQQKGISGRVVLRFVVDKNGQAQEAEVVESEPEGVFDESALAVVKKYKFRPAMKGGKPVDCIVRLPIKFSVGTE